MRIEDGVHRIGIFRPRFEEEVRNRPTSPPSGVEAEGDDDISLQALDSEEESSQLEVEVEEEEEEQE